MWLLYHFLGQAKQFQGIKGSGQSHLVRAFLHEGGYHLYNGGQTARLVALEGTISGRYFELIEE